MIFELSPCVNEISPLFCQLNELNRDPTSGQYLYWKESARWVRFEEKAENVIGRWSKPHVATLPRMAIESLTDILSEALCLFDVSIKEPKEITDLLRNLFEDFFSCKDDLEKFLTINNLPHVHHHQKDHEKISKTNGERSEFIENSKFKRKINRHAEGACIQIAPLDFVQTTKLSFLRFQSAPNLQSLFEICLPSRFLVYIVGPLEKQSLLYEMGRVMSTCLADDYCREHFYLAKTINDLIQTISLMNKGTMVLPPSEWDPKLNIEPPVNYLSLSQRKAFDLTDYIHQEQAHEDSHEDLSLKANKRPFIGLYGDIRKKLPWYLSDFVDCLNLQCVAATLYMYLVCLCSLVAFGALLGQSTDNYMATMECILSGAICGVLFALFSGQPLNILSATGPMLILEKIICSLCTKNGLNFMEFRLWIGFWIAIFLLLLVTFNLSFLVKYITRFTEDSFASLVAIMFIVDAFKSLLQINNKYPTNLTGKELQPYKNCYCQNDTSFVFTECPSSLWTCDLISKKYSPDIFFFSVILFAFTFILCQVLKSFRDSSFFPNVIRQLLSDFSVLLAILSASVINALVGVNTPKLTVPSELKPTRNDRGWVIPFYSGDNPIWTIFIAIVPAIIATLLVFMDQQITAVIINKKEFKFKKDVGYHLDLLVVAITILICSILGLPWFIAATVLALTHVNSLKVMSENSAPGEKVTFLGVREQRVTYLLVSIFIGFSVFITKILSHIPMPVLYAVFLHMGVSTLNGLQFVDRILLLFMPAKYQPDFSYLKNVKTNRVHFYTFFQIMSLAAMWLVKQIDTIAIAFPLLVVFTCFMRKLLDFVFTQHELMWLDQLLPSGKTKNAEEKTEIKELMK